METLFILLKILYGVAITGLTIYGLYGLTTATLFIIKKLRRETPAPAPIPITWPTVTVQLPVCNERHLIERLLKAVSRMDYDPALLQIQVLDDSTDDTTLVTRRLVNEYQAKGFNIQLVQRKNHREFKAGNLKEGMKTARGELVAIFDADFIPTPGWLKKTVPLLVDDAQMACIQTRWGHTNREFNSLTRAQGLLLDAHFIVEHGARLGSKLFNTFNGTAVLWRRSALDDVGGWEGDTLTEDLDLSFRVQLRGWRIGFLPDAVVPGELPIMMEDFKKQQFRWAKGATQVARKLLPQVLSAPDLPWYTRLYATLHLTAYFSQPLMVFSALLILPVGVFVPEIFQAFPWSVVAAFGPPLIFLLAGATQTPRLFERAKHVPLLVLIGIGLSLSNTLAVIEGLFGKTGTFIPTPKFNLGPGEKERELDETLLSPVSPMIWGEIALGLYSLLTAWILAIRLGPAYAAWPLGEMLGFFYISGFNLLQNRQAQAARARNVLNQQA